MHECIMELRAITRAFLHAIDAMQSETVMDINAGIIKYGYIDHLFFSLSILTSYSVIYQRI